MSEFRRFFSTAEERDGDTVFLRNEYNHLAKVLRAKVGDTIIVCFNDGYDHYCQITDITSSVVQVKIISTTINPCESGIKITCYVGCLKGGNMDLVVQKAVELGASAIVPFTSAFSVSNCDAKKAERLTKISYEASKQCGRALKIDVTQDLSFSGLLNGLRQNNYDAVYFCDERGGIPLASALDVNHKNIAVVVGSEGGFSLEEQKQLRTLACGVSLGKRILRAETATIFALSVIGAFNDKND